MLQFFRSELYNTAYMSVSVCVSLREETVSSIAVDDVKFITN